MTLREYVGQYQRSLRVKVRTLIADELGVPYFTLRSYEFRQRLIPPHFLPKLEDVTNGSVRFEDMRPDITENRKELKGSIRKAKIKIMALETSQAHQKR